jgi:RNA-directed DNA polymerase
MPVVQKFDYPKTESEFRLIQDEIYRKSKIAVEKGESPCFKGLLEIIKSEVVILTAIHNIKSNKGSNTAGSDGKTMRKDILEKDYPTVIKQVQESLMNYKPLPVRRVYIPKPGKMEKRPLGIPAIVDRVVQECVRLVIEPILEAHFFKHSYGFRPMRNPHMAIERATNLVHKTGYHWVVEGDISKFFDKVNHTILIKRLWHMGVRDRRILIVIKSMLKAGIMDEIKVNPLGTPQGGIISPLLANAYLHALDKWIVREWEEKKTTYPYKDQAEKLRALRQRSNLKPAYLIRYADDWILITNTKSNAEKWKKRIDKFLGIKLKLKLSEEKTLITNIKRKSIKFLGFDYRIKRGNSRTGWIASTSPNKERLEAKVKDIHTNIRKLKHVAMAEKEQLIHRINLINSQIRGIIQYYEPATRVHENLSKHAWKLRFTGYHCLVRHGGKLIKAEEANNLTSVHSNYSIRIPSIEYKGLKVGLTDLSFCKWQKCKVKNPEEIPYSAIGRELHQKRTNSKPLLARADGLLSIQYSEIISKNKDPLYNFEYFLNRAYAFNRDRGVCKVCGEAVMPEQVNIHHISPQLPLLLVNRVQNLTTVHVSCHYKIHSNDEYPQLPTKVRNKIRKYREKLSIT